MGTLSALPAVFSFGTAFGLACGTGSPPRRSRRARTQKTRVKYFLQEMRWWWAGCSLLPCCQDCRVLWALTPLQLRAVGGRGPAGSPRPKRDGHASSCGRCSGESSWPPAPLLRSGARGFLLRGGSLRKGWDGGRKQAAKSLISSASPLAPAGAGGGSSPRSLPKNQAEVKSRGIALLLLAGGCRCYQMETRTGWVNAGYLFTVFGFLSLSFFPPSANVGGTPEKGLGVTHCAACWASTRAEKGFQQKEKRHKPNSMQFSTLVLIFLRSTCWFLTLKMHLQRTVERTVVFSAERATPSADLKCELVLEHLGGRQP